MAQKQGPTNGIKSDETLLRVLAELRESGVKGVTEIANEVGVSKSTVYKHLQTLENYGYVKNTGGEYQLDFGFFWLGGYVRNQNRLCREAKSVVRDLSQKMDEMVTFSVRDGNYGMWIYLEGDVYGVRKRHSLGGRFYLHQPAMGKAMLAELDRNEVDRIINETGLQQSTDKTVSTREELHECLDEIQERGFATNVEEHQTNAQAIAAPVYDEQNETLGAIGIAGPASKWTIQRFQEEYSQVVLDTASDLQLHIQYQ